MSTYQIIPLLASIFLFCSVGLQAHDGTINVTGQITSSTCSVTDDSRSKSVALGTVKSIDFSGVDATSGAVDFTITLKDCNASNATVTFSGNKDSDNPSLLAIKDTIDSAEGIAIAILDDDKNIIDMDAASKIYAVDSYQSINTLHFYAEYMATSPQIKAGEANATATFTVSYD